MRAVPINRYWAFFLIAGGGLAVDLATKHWMFAWLGMPDRPEALAVGRSLRFETSLNEGALFGMGQGMVWLFSLAFRRCGGCRSAGVSSWPGPPGNGC